MTRTAVFTGKEIVALYLKRKLKVPDAFDVEARYRIKEAGIGWVIEKVA